MIPVDAVLAAPPGYLLIERLEMPLQRGRIIVPKNIRMSTRSCEAVVVSVGAALFTMRDAESLRWRPLHPGDRVFLAAGVGRPIKLGIRDERTLYRITPSNILARIVGDETTGIENQGVAPQEIADWEIEAASIIDEGESEALR